MTLSRTLIDPNSFGSGGNTLSVGTLCLRAFQMLEDDSDKGFGFGIGPLRPFIRQEALPLAIRLLLSH